MPKLRARGANLGTLTGAQRETLLFGESICSYPEREEFRSEAEIALAWRTHRRALLAEYDHPGRRPWAFWKFDMGADPVPDHWWGQAGELERLGLLSREEEIRLERTRRELAPDQGELFEALFARRWDAYTLRRLRAEFEFTAGWHGRRGRADLEAKYQRLSGVAQAQLGGHDA